MGLVEPGSLALQAEEGFQALDALGGCLGPWLVRPQRPASDLRSGHGRAKSLEAWQGSEAPLLPALQAPGKVRRPNGVRYQS